jgi:hypothetical protein
MLAAGAMIAAPTAHAGQIAPKMYAVSWRLSRTIDGREPIGAPHITKRTFPPHSGVVRKPDLELRSRGGAVQGFRQAGVEVF